MLARIKSGHDWLALALFIVVAVLIALTFRHYGVGWDEEFHHDYGALVHKYYATYFGPARDLGALNYRELKFYGGLFDVVGFELNRVLPFNEYENRHLWNAVVGLLGLLGCWRLAREIAGPAAGFWSALLLALTPAYYGHMFNNPKDIPFAVGYVWSLYYFVRLIYKFPRVPISILVRLGLAIGATLGVRVGGFVLVAYAVGAAGIYIVARAVQLRRVPREELRQIATKLVIVGAVAYGLMLLFWPFAAEHPIKAPIASFRGLTHILNDEILRFQGRDITTNNLPWFYLPQYLLIQIPEIVLVLLLAGGALGVLAIVKRRFMSCLPRAAAIGMVTFAAVFPVAFIIVTHPVVYDAARHVTFVLPPIACLAGMTLARLLSSAAGRGRIVRYAAAAALLLFVQAPLRAMVALHPYQYVYFNSLVGGLHGAAGRYETDYWAECYRESVERLTERLDVESREFGTTGSNLVYVVEPWNSATFFFPPNLVWTRDVQEADFAITFTRYDSPATFKGDPTYLTVERQRAPLCYVFDLRNRPR